MERLYGKKDFVDYLQVDNKGQVPNATFAMRALDIVMASIGLLLTFPILLIVSCLVFIEDQGNVLFFQKRLGLNKKEFTVIKFRSMYINAEKGVPQWAQKNDPRITKVGKYLRKLHLDELPQLYNILKGDMAIVGPRPIRAHLAEPLIELDFRYNYRFMAKPGLTGLAQLYAPYGANVEEQLKKVPYDLQYFNNFTFRHYCKIIFLTGWRILTTGKSSCE